MKITINKKMKLRIEPRKIGESRKDYRKYIEECFEEQFPKKTCTKKILNKIERTSYNYSYDHDGINFCGNSTRGLIQYISRAMKKDKKPKAKKENKVVGFFKNLFGRKNKNIDTEETFEENIPELVELTEDDLPNLEETFEENLPEFKETFEENLPESKKENTNSLPIEIKSYRDLNQKEVSNMSVMAQLRYLQEQNKKQAEIINNTINNFNVYLENFKKLEQENLRLRKEITRLSYNPNSFVIKNAYEEAIKEEQIRKLQSIHNSFVNSNKDYIHDDLTANQYNVDRVKVLTRK